MSKENKEYGMILDDPNGAGVLLVMNGTMVYEVFYRRYGDSIFRSTLILSARHVDGVVGAEFLEEFSARSISFAYRLGQPSFKLDGMTYRTSGSTPFSRATIELPRSLRFTEQLVVRDDLLIVVRSNAEDHESTNRRMFIGNEDGTGMREVTIHSLTVKGDSRGAIYVTSEGTLTVPPLYMLGEEPKWNNVRMFHCDEGDFIIDERSDGSILVGQKW